MSPILRPLVVVASILLFAPVGSQGQPPPQAADSLVRSADAALTAGNYREAVRACADALRRFPDDAAARACAKRVEPHLPEIVSGASALLGAGDAEGALDRCSAVLVLTPLDKEANACAGTARIQIAAHARDTLKLEQARGFLAAGDHARASQSILELSKSEFPDVLTGSVELQDRLNRGATEQVDLTSRAAIERAALLVAYGKQDDAVKILQDVLTSNASAPVHAEALRALSDARPSLRRSFMESLRNPWAVQALAVLSMIAGLWIALHWVRDLWRWFEARFISGAHGRWKFAPITPDDALGARDAILDALRRVPHEVHKPIWTPTRLLLYPYDDCWDVWEDFCVSDPDKAKVVHENVFNMSVQQSGGDKILSDAFQNLQFTVGNVGVGSVTKFWTGLVEWWHTGEPSFSATCQELPISDGSKHVAIRLSATGPAGTTSVMATTDRQSGLDAVSVSAERAAYKLLFTMSDHKDSAAQIDGHAAFRQGVTSLSRSARAMVDTKIDKDKRQASIFEAIPNLEVARRSFERDGEHRVYHLQSLRFLGVAYALVGRDVAARMILEELEDLADKPSSEANEANRRRDEQLKVEAQYNQAMLYCRMVAEGGDESRPSLAMSEALMGNVARLDPALSDAVRVWGLLHLNNLSWREWRSLNPEQVRKQIESAAALPEELDKRAATAVGADRRHNSLLATHARRNLAIARLRRLAAFELPARGPFGRPDRRLPDEILEVVQTACDSIGTSGLLGPLTPRGAVARAYGLLLLSKWFDAEEEAREALASDASDQFALYVAAEASLQRRDLPIAQKYLAGTRQMTIVEPALLALIEHLGVLDTVEATVAANTGVS